MAEASKAETSVEGGSPTASPTLAPSASLIAGIAGLAKAASKAAIVSTFSPTPAPTPTVVVDPPQLDSFTCFLSSVDVTKADKTLSCTATGTSSVGIAYVSGAFYNGPMTKRLLVEILAAADDPSSTLTGTLAVPMGTDHGTWTLAFADSDAFYR